MPINTKTKIPDSVQIPYPDLVNIYGDVKIGENCFIGPFTEIQSGVKIGENCRIQSHSFLCEGVILGNNVFWGHGAKAVNDKYPKVNNKNFTLEMIHVGDHVCVGTNATLVGPLVICTGSLIGAGSVVTYYVYEDEVVIGNPAKPFKKIK